MTRKAASIALVFAVTGSSLPASVAAQAPLVSSRWAIDIAAAAALPVGNSSPSNGHTLYGVGWDGFKTGWEGMGAVEYRLRAIHFRLEGAWTRFPLATGEEGHANVTRLALDVAYDLSSPTASVQPYVIAGAGAYDVGVYHCFILAGTVCTTDAHVSPGVNAGAGLRLALSKPVSAFGEVRYHIAFSANYAALNPENAPFIPLALGLQLHL